jgi:hypothetical protein
MKKQVIEFLKQFHCVTRYSGETQVMYISYSKSSSPKKLTHTLAAIRKLVIKEFGWDLPFTLA